jgi:hypothetical protein
MPQYSPRPPAPASAPPISLPHHCPTFPFRCGSAASIHILDLPLLRLQSPRTRICIRGRCRYPSQLPGPPSSATGPAHGYDVLNPESGWGPAGSGGAGRLRVRADPRPPRWEKKEEQRDGERSDGAPARRSDAERKVWRGGSWCVSRGVANTECIYVWGRSLVTYHSDLIASHFFMYLVHTPESSLCLLYFCYLLAHRSPF